MFHPVLTMYGYRAPSTVPFATPLRSGLRLAFTSVVALSTVAFVGSIGCLSTGAILSSSNHEVGDVLGIVGACALGLTILLAYVQIGLGIAWVYRVWSWLPPEERWTRLWRNWITPASAAFMLLLPYFHFYWMVVVNHGLCEALDRMRARFPTREPAPRGLAIAAEVCQFIIPIPVAALLWTLYMRRVEAVIAELAAAPVPR